MPLEPRALGHQIVVAAVHVVPADLGGVGALDRAAQRGSHQLAAETHPEHAHPGVDRALRLAVERKRLDRAARKAYATDLSTGLPNHAQLLEHMTHLLALREREPAPMALLVLRIEGLSTAEAALGAEAANVLRRKVAVRLRAGLRASDVVAALGADSFAVLLAWIDTPADGQRVADKLIQGYDVRNLKLGNTLSDDQLPGERFDYCLANPPFGVKWEAVQKFVNNERASLGYAGRFGPGLPRVGDGSLLFLMHLLAKRKPVEQGGTRIGIVLSGSPLFNGGAGSGESEIRRWILENDWLEAIAALPTDLFYNTGIGTYVWLLSNHKAPQRRGKVQLIDASGQHSPMRKSLGSKRKTISQELIEAIARWHDASAEAEHSKLFDTIDFGYRRITVERPLRLRFDVTAATLKAYADAKGSDQVERFATLLGHATFDSLDALLAAAKVKKLGKATRKAVLDSFGTRDPAAQPVADADGSLLPDPELREFENVPLKDDIRAYFAREVLPHVPDAWIDEGKTDDKDGLVGVVGYEINFNRYFYTYVPPRPLAEIDADLKAVEAEIAALTALPIRTAPAAVLPELKVSNLARNR